MECIVCNKNLRDSDFLKSHMLRHTKADLINVFATQCEGNKSLSPKIKIEVNGIESENQTVDSSFNSHGLEESLSIDNIYPLNCKTEFENVSLVDVRKNGTNKFQPKVEYIGDNNNEYLNSCKQCSPKKKKKTRILKKESLQGVRKSKTNKQVAMKPIRRSTRTKYISSFSPLSNQNIYLTPRKNDNISNYYIPDFAKIKSLTENDLENLENVNMDMFMKDSPNCVEPILKTPKVEATKTSSDTESCSGNGTVYSVDDEIYCVYCGNGYKNTESLESHLHKHLNFCIMCNIDFNSLSAYIEHLHSHTHKIYICQYCNAEYISKDVLNLHLKHHLEDNFINDVLTLETDFKTDRTQINQFYGYYNAGYEFARSSADTKNTGSDFYKTFLQMNVDESRNFYRHFYCQICLRNFSDGSIYSDHVRNYHF